MFIPVWAIALIIYMVLSLILFSQASKESGYFAGAGPMLEWFVLNLCMLVFFVTYFVMKYAGS